MATPLSLIIFGAGMLANGGFETGTPGVIPTGWTLDPAYPAPPFEPDDTTATLDATTYFAPGGSHRGRRSLKILRTIDGAPTGSGVSDRRIWQRITWNRGPAWACLSGMIKRQSSAGGLEGFPSVTIMDPARFAGLVGPGYRTILQATAAVGVWTPFYVMLPIYDGDWYISFTGFTKQGGSLWLDGLEFGEVLAFGTLLAKDFGANVFNFVDDYGSHTIGLDLDAQGDAMNPDEPVRWQNFRLRDADGPAVRRSHDDFWTEDHGPAGVIFRGLTSPVVERGADRAYYDGLSLTTQHSFDVAFRRFLDFAGRDGGHFSFWLDRTKGLNVDGHFEDCILGQGRQQYTYAPGPTMYRARIELEAPSESVAGR